MYSIDVDIGGTFTDGFFTDGENVRTEKVLTTPHDITECFMNCVQAGSKAFNLELPEFLRRTAVARVSTTVGTNLLVQHAGPKIGLVVTHGHETDLYGKGMASILGRYISPELVVGVPESIGDTGKVVHEVDRAELLAGVRRLVQMNARMIVVSFKNAWRNAHNEKLASQIIRERYPMHYLRSVPLQIATEVMHVADDHTRTNTAVFNAYIHGEMARTLYRADDKLRAAGYERPLLIVHSSGGNARVAKTVAVHTLHSGPAVAARGAAFLARLLDLDHVVTSDMGGTSFDVAIVDNGEAAFNLTPEIDGIRIATPMIEVESLGAGGGSIARVENGKLRVGPESASSAPGPVCYGKGGVEPTVTDANLILGYIDPEYFLGGRMSLDMAAAKRSMDRRISSQLAMSLDDAAFAVRESINNSMADELARRIAGHGGKAANFTLFSFGGAGPLHACAIAELIGIKRIYAFPYGSVFSAFGGSTTKVQHLYSHTLGIPLSEASRASATLADFKLQAVSDMAGEGFSGKEVATRAQISVAIGNTRRTIALANSSTKVKEAISKALGKSAARAIIESVRLTAECDVAHWTPPTARRGAVGTLSPKLHRPVFWERGRSAQTPIYDRFGFKYGQVIDGPAIVEGPDTSYPIAPGWRLEVDQFGNFVMTKG